MLRAGTPTCVDADEGPPVQVVAATDPPAAILGLEDLQPDPDAPLHQPVLAAGPVAAAPRPALVQARRNRLRQPLVAVAPPPGRHGDAGAAGGVPAAVCTVAAGVKEGGAAAQEAAVRPAVLSVPEVGGPGLVPAHTQLHRRRLRPPAQVLPSSDRQRGRVQLDQVVEGEEVHLEEGSGSEPGAGSGSGGGSGPTCRMS